MAQVLYSFRMTILLVCLNSALTACPYTGSLSKHEFQAETKQLLDIVARSLYSEKEVSNAPLPELCRFIALLPIVVAAVASA